MAVKKPIKRDTTNPNTALVLFLVFFVLLSIGLGVWGYYGYSGQTKLKEEAKNAQKDKEAAKLGEDASTFGLLELRQAVLDLTPDERTPLEKLRKDFADGRFKGEKSVANMETWAKDMGDLIGYDNATKNYTSTFKKKVGELSADVTKLQGELAKANKDLKAEQDKYLNLGPATEAHWKKWQKDLATRMAEVQTVSGAQFDKMNEAFKMIADLQKQKDETDEAYRQKFVKLEAEKNLYRQQLAELKEKVATITPVEASRAALIEPHALMLDISPGRAFWDEPLGKITRVDLREQQVYLNIGSARGVKPELTFNVFSPGPHGRAEKGLKGTIEVQRVLDANSSVARITSLYDIDGLEIALNDPNRLRREAENPMKEGDLLFNMGWGTHVVLAGPVNWTGLPGESSADQVRHMQSFMSLLERMGVAVDAYIDLASGELRGAITAKTRFMIRGDNLFVDKDGKPEANKRINDAVQAVRKEAVERGMFIISADNFATVIGHKRPRTAADSDTPPFRPTVPYAGSTVGTRRVDAPPAPPAEPPMEKEKEKEKVEKEKN